MAVPMDCADPLFLSERWASAAWAFHPNLSPACPPPQEAPVYDVAKMQQRASVRISAAPCPYDHFARDGEVYCHSEGKHCSWEECPLKQKGPAAESSEALTEEIFR